MIKRIFAFVLLVLVICLICKSWHSFTGGFKTNKITPPKDCISRVNEIPRNLTNEFLKVFDQEYRFLGKGCQVYVFESKDSKYVLKFLRHHKYKLPFWLNLIDVNKKLKEHKKKVSIYKKSRVKNAFNSYLFAYEMLKEKTGIIYLHLGITNYLNKKVTIIDRLGQKHILDLDTNHFILQKKAIPLKPYLLNCCKKNKLNKATLIIDGYLEVIKHRALMGIKNVDHSGYLRNMGFIDNKVIEIDVGGYRQQKEVATKEGVKKEFLAFANKLERWSERKSKNVLEYIRHKKAEILKEALEEVNENF